MIINMIDYRTLSSLDICLMLFVFFLNMHQLKQIDHDDQDSSFDFRVFSRV